MEILIGLAALAVLFILWALWARWHATTTWTVVTADGTRVPCSGVDNANRTAHFAAYAAGPKATVKKTGLCRLTVMQQP